MDLRYPNCPHCFSNRNPGDSCAVCGFRYNKVNSQPESALPAFSMLNERYLIGHCLGKGGFGITYSALDLKTNVRCAIKEYYPQEFAVRNIDNNMVNARNVNKAPAVFEHAKERFLGEAQLLYKLSNSPNVVKLYNYFKENNTAYIVMEFLEGNDLREYTKNMGGRIPLEMAVQALDSCASALEVVHKMGFLHRDISPDNIFVKTNRQTGGNPQYVLLDFGAARNYIGNNAHTMLLKPGFAPPEAYSKTGNIGPWTDIYSLAATMYNVLSGNSLLDVSHRLRGAKQPTLAELGVPVPKAFSDVIDTAMQLDFRRRPQTMDEFRRCAVMASGVSLSRQSLSTEINGGNNGTRGRGDSQASSPSRQPDKQRSRIVGKLIIDDGSRKGMSITLYDGKPIKIGRSVQSSNFVLDYIGGISRVHCFAMFSAKDRMLHLTDVSANGTFFENNERLYKEKTYIVPPGRRFFLVRRDCMIRFAIEEEVM